MFLGGGIGTSLERLTPAYPIFDQTYLRYIYVFFVTMLVVCAAK